jgi:hypothetical protein
MRLAASGAPATVKRRAVNPVHTLKILPVYSKYEFVFGSNESALRSYLQVFLKVN